MCSLTSWFSLYYHTTHPDWKLLPNLPSRYMVKYYLTLIPVRERQIKYPAIRCLAEGEVVSLVSVLCHRCHLKVFYQQQNLKGIAHNSCLPGYALLILLDHQVCESLAHIPYHLRCFVLSTFKMISLLTNNNLQNHSLHQTTGSFVVNVTLSRKSFVSYIYSKIRHGTVVVF